MPQCAILYYFRIQQDVCIRYHVNHCHIAIANSLSKNCKAACWGQRGNCRFQFSVKWLLLSGWETAQGLQILPCCSAMNWRHKELHKSKKRLQIVWFVEKASILWWKLLDVLELSCLTFLNQATPEPTFRQLYMRFISFNCCHLPVVVIWFVLSIFILWNHDLGVVSALPVDLKKQ